MRTVGCGSDVGNSGIVMSEVTRVRQTEPFGAAPHERPVPRISIQAFCEFPDTGAALQRAGADRRLSKAHLSVQLGGIQAAVEQHSGQVTPNLLIVETRLQRQGGAGRNRPAGRGLRSVEQGRRHRPRQRRGTVPRADAPGRQRISRGAAQSAASDRGDFGPLSRSGCPARSAASWALSAPRRRGMLDPRAQCRLVHRRANCTSTPRSSISTLPFGTARPRLQRGAEPGRRRSAVCARAAGRRVAGPSAAQARATICRCSPRPPCMDRDIRCGAPDLTKR